MCIVGIVLLLFGIAVYPEDSAKLLTDPGQWTLHGKDGSPVFRE
jgi:hypothetical protein